MALIKSKPYKYGIVTTYWSIDKINLNFTDKNGSVILSGYIDENSKKVKNEDKTDYVLYLWEGENFTFTKTGNNILEAYAKIKQSKLDENGNETNFFFDAEDSI